MTFVRCCDIILIAMYMVGEEFFDDEMCVSLDSVMMIVNQLQESKLLLYLCPKFYFILISR